MWGNGLPGPPLLRPITLAAQARFLACDGKQMLFTRAWSRWKPPGAKQCSGVRTPTWGLSAIQHWFKTDLKWYSMSLEKLLYPIPWKTKPHTPWWAEYLTTKNRPSLSQAVWHRTEVSVCASLSSKYSFSLSWFPLDVFQLMNHWRGIKQNIWEKMGLVAAPTPTNLYICPWGNQVVFFFNFQDPCLWMKSSAFLILLCLLPLCLLCGLLDSQYNSSKSVESEWKGKNKQIQF